MFLQKFNKINNLFDLNIFIVSFLIFFFKWISSFWIFGDENLINKILFDISDIYYFPFILNILDLNFSPDYLNDFESENLIPIPIYSIFVHAIFFKIFGILSFFILELIFLYFFLVIVNKILINCDINYYLALLTSVFIFVLPALLSNIELFKINLNIVNGLFNFRFPRPLVTSCYFFWGLYLALSYYKDKKFNLSSFLYTGVCLSLLFVSYYYNFINLIILFIYLLINKILIDENYFKKNYQNLCYSILIFLFMVAPYLYLYSLSEKDFSSMIGVITTNYDLKVELFLHFLNNVFTLKFILIFVLITFLRFFLLKFENQINGKIIKFFYFLFLATLLSPFFFVIISPSVSEIYHFLNWIVIISFLTLIIYFCLYINFITKDFLIKSSKVYNSIAIFFSFFLILIFQLINYEKILNDNDKLIRNDYVKLQSLVDNNLNDINNLLSFSVRPQVMWMIKGKKEFSSIESSISSLNFEQLEKNFIVNLKFLNLNSDDFSEIISNKRGSWRYNNESIKYISWYKYQANSLVTFNNSNDFTTKEKEFIKNSSPTKTQQIALPKFEINRLKNLFSNFKTNKDFNNPDLIILKKNSLISQYASLDDKNYCEIKGYQTLKIYLNKNVISCD